jgi:hypothetical protein
MKRRVDIKRTIGDYLYKAGGGQQDTDDSIILLYDIAESLQRVVEQLDVLIENTEPRDG